MIFIIIFFPIISLNCFHYYNFIYLNNNSENEVGEKVYNLSDVLSAATSSSYAHQQQQLYFHPIPTLDSIIPIGGNKEKKSERYYIYSHTKGPHEKDEKDRKIINKNRKERSSTMDRKQVSRNISLVLENLLMSYEKSQLPGMSIFCD